MKIIKFISIALISLLVSFLLTFIVLEFFKYTDDVGLFRARNPYDLVIKNARMIDGNGGEIKRVDIAIRDDVIIRIGNNLKTDGAKVLNAAGFTVAPNKVEWPQNVDWVKRDLTSALKRYPENRVIVIQAQEKEWEGRSVKALILGGLTKDRLASDPTAMAWIMPEMEIPEAEDVNTAFYLLTGWRGELLDEKIGKIKEASKANFVVYNHREINDELLLDILKKEKLPSVRYIIEGSSILVNEN